MLLGGCCPQPILLNAPCHAEVDQMTEVIRKRRSTERLEYGEVLSVIQKCAGLCGPWPLSPYQ